MRFCIFQLVRVGTLPFLQPAEIQWMYIFQKCLVGCIFDSKIEFAVIITSNTGKGWKGPRRAGNSKGQKKSQEKWDKNLIGSYDLFLYPILYFNYYSLIVSQSALNSILNFYLYLDLYVFLISSQRNIKIVLFDIYFDKDSC